MFKQTILAVAFILLTGLSLADGGMKININTADVQTMSDAFKGIGPNKAQAIVEYREKNGPFATVDELIDVKGIGTKIVEVNKDKMTVSSN